VSIVLISLAIRERLFDILNALMLDQVSLLDPAYVLLPLVYANSKVYTILRKVKAGRQIEHKVQFLKKEETCGN